MLIEPALKLAKSLALKKATRYADENMSHGSTALKHIEADMYTLAAEIYEYQSKFEAAKSVMNRQRVENVDFIRQCNKTFPLQEVDGILRLRDELRKIGSVAADIEAGAIARAQGHALAAEKEMKRWEASLRRTEKYNGDANMQRRIAQKMRTASNDLVRFEKDMRSTDLRGDALQQLCADLIATVMEIRRQLLQYKNTFAYFAKDCNTWRAQRIEQGVY